jgi:hypothetical protein
MNFQKRTIYLREEKQRETLLALIPNLPLDDARPLQITIEEYRPTRKLSQQAYLFAGPLKDISEQAWLDGKQYSVDVWAHYFKEQLLPEEFDPALCKDSYQKWRYDPAGNRVLTGSTTELTVKGMAEYITAITAFGGSLGVQFSERAQ